MKSSSKVTEIVFTFENIEQMAIKVQNHAGEDRNVSVNLKGITNSVNLYASWDTLSKQQMVEEATITIGTTAIREAKRIVPGFGVFTQDDPEHEADMASWERLAAGDIVALDLAHEDGTTEEYYLPWEDGDDSCTNMAQHALWLGALYSQDVPIYPGDNPNEHSTMVLKFKTSPTYKYRQLVDNLCQSMDEASLLEEEVHEYYGDQEED